MGPPNISPPGACSWKITLEYNVKQSKNGKFTSNYKASPIVDKPLQKYKPRGLFSEFYGNSFYEFYQLQKELSILLYPNAYLYFTFFFGISHVYLSRAASRML